MNHSISRTTATRAAWIAPAFFAFTFFSYGTAMMDYFLVYPSRLIVGESEFVAYHALLEERILPISVIPFGLLTILNILLFWFRPGHLPKGLVWASLLCLLLDWVSSIFFQIPMNLQLNHGKDPALIQHVMDTNWGRIFLESAQALIAFLMMQSSQSNDGFSR
jgi:hypothetical protein